MTHANPTTPGDTISGVTCGNCGATAAAGAMTCPRCGVLLAAYQAPAGASEALTAVPAAYAPVSAPAFDASPVTTGPVDTSATHETPTAAMVADESAAAPVSPTPAPIAHWPRSQSPIADALRRVEHEDVEASALEDSAAAAAALSEMATSESDFAREIEAELAGAKVTFEGGSPVITTEPEAAAEPVVVPVAAAPPAAPALAVDDPAASLPERFRPKPARDDPGPTPAVPPVATATPSQPVRRTVASPSKWPRMATIPAPQKADPERKSPLGSIVVLVILGLVFFRSFSGVGSLFAVVIGIGVVVLLLKLVRTSGRKTTAMPWDERWDRSPRRRK